MKRPYTSLLLFAFLFCIVLSVVIRGRYDGVAFLFTILSVVFFAHLMHEVEDTEKAKAGTEEPFERTHNDDAA